jgi:hypothetical protein
MGMIFLNNEDVNIKGIIDNFVDSLPETAQES